MDSALNKWLADLSSSLIIANCVPLVNTTSLTLGSVDTLRAIALDRIPTSIGTTETLDVFLYVSVSPAGPRRVENQCARQTKLLSRSRVTSPNRLQPPNDGDDYREEIPEENFLLSLFSSWAYFIYCKCDVLKLGVVLGFLTDYYGGVFVVSSIQ